MYKSPIEIVQGELHTYVENEVMKAVRKVGVNVDKEELIKALAYDRGQFGEGHKQGMEDAWKIAQTVFGSTVTLYEAMDVAKCMKEQSNE